MLTVEYMFHPHQDAITQNGCIGAFKVQQAGEGNYEL
jgi:FtsP/CotA-like multicopper oxidase with cupredoxin domain